MAMDIFASKLLHVLALAAAAAVVLSGCGAIIFIICMALGRLPEADQKKLAGCWIAFILPLLLLVPGTMLLLHFSAWHRFNSIMTQKPNQLIISSQGKTNQINDPVAIAQFYQIVTRSKKETAHHSHTVSDAQLFFPQTGYIYSLARDSQYPNQFWFGWSGISGRSRDRIPIGASLGQLRSDELAAWVEKYSPTSDH